MNQVVSPAEPPAKRAASDLQGTTRFRLHACRLLSLVLAGSVMASATVLSAAPAHAVEIYPRPADGILTISGHGFGHGHGLSQWGAYGAAKVGKLSWQGIVGFYYPGTTLANVGNPTIRVRLAAAGSGPLTVFNGEGLRLGGQTLPATSGTTQITQYRVRSLPTAGKLGVDMRTATGWTPYPTAASPTVLSSPAVFSNSSRSAVDVLLTNGTRRAYRGSVYANWTTTTTLTTVSVLPMESYLRAVVPVEMSPSWHPNALAAQAVAARSYANYGRVHALAGRTWDTCDTTACQSYAGVPAEYGASDLAIAATAGQTLTLAGAATFTEFGAANGGWSAAGGQSYLRAQADPYDGAIPNNANSWTATITAASIQARYPSIGTFSGLRILSRDGHGQWGGRVLTAGIDGSAGSVSVTGSSFSSAFGLRSPWFIPTNAVTAPVPPVVTPPTAPPTAPPSAPPSAPPTAPPTAPPVVLPPAEPWAATSYTPYKGVVLQQGSTGAAVVVLQRGLKITPDGIFGPVTRAALVTFQGKQVLALNGVTNRLVWDRLEKQDYPLIAYRGLTLQQGSTGTVVVALQRALRVSADGDFGPLTASAVKSVQLSAKLAQTGIVSAWTWVAIEKAMPR